MDPVVASVAIKTLDILFFTGLYLLERAASKEEYAKGQALVAEAARLKALAQDGTITPEQLEQGLDQIHTDIVAPMRAAIERL